MALGPCTARALAHLCYDSVLGAALTTLYTYVTAQINHPQTHSWCLAKLQGEGQDAECVAGMMPI